MRNVFLCLGVVLPLIVTSSEVCADWQARSGGQVGLSTRAFYPDDKPETEDVGLALESELEYKGKSGGWRTHISGFGRVGVFDNSRSIAFLKDAWVGYKTDAVEIRLGAQVLNWTATEAFHPSDVVNSRNLDSNLENSEKIGEPMARIRFRMGQGGLTILAMPMRIESRFPGRSSRLSLAGDALPAGLELGEPIWVDSGGTEGNEWWAVQYGFRFDQTVASMDFALYYLHHNERFPTAFALNQSGISPVYAHVQRAGATWTQAVGEWLIKLEADHSFVSDVNLQESLVVSPPRVDHTAVALGVEWGWPYENAEGTVLVEGQYAIAPGASAEERAQLGPFENDVLVGYRHSWNNAEGTELTTGIILDVERPDEVLGNVLLSHRLSDYFSVEASGRVVFADSEESILHGQNGAHLVQISLIRFF